MIIVCTCVFVKHFISYIYTCIYFMHPFFVVRRFKAVNLRCAIKNLSGSQFKIKTNSK